jgi:hypothetical protein
MATDLAVYFLRQGTYSKEGDIVILVRPSLLLVFSSCLGRC